MRLVIISGRSGSGKSSALHVLEDMGFYCIDNLPIALLPALVQQTDHENHLSRIAVSVDARNLPHAFGNIQQILHDLPSDEYQLRSEEHTSELQSRPHLVCRLLLEKKNTKNK